jgi:hypothetical protein
VAPYRDPVDGQTPGVLRPRRILTADFMTRKKTTIKKTPVLTAGTHHATTGNGWSRRYFVCNDSIEYMPIGVKFRLEVSKRPIDGAKKIIIHREGNKLTYGRETGGLRFTLFSRAQKFLRESFRFTETPTPIYYRVYVIKSRATK